MRIETRAVHAGRGVDPATGAVTVPIHLATTFERDPDGSYPRGHLYARNSNPTRAALEACVPGSRRRRRAAARTAARVGLFTRATSFGGTESLIEHRASIEGPGSRTPDDLLRVSVGLEHPDDLIEDLAQALA